MTTILFILSLLLFSLTDYCKDKYPELYKIGFLAIFFCGWYMDWNFGLVIAWVFLHYPVHNVIQGILRHRNPLYLGDKWFDRLVKFLFPSWWMYLISLVASLGIGINEYLRRRKK